MPRRAINSGPSPQLLSRAEKLFADVFIERANSTSRSQRTCRFAGGKCSARRSAAPSLGLRVVRRRQRRKEELHLASPAHRERWRTRAPKSYRIRCTALLTTNNVYNDVPAGLS